jgi:hypothetical protein
VTRAEPKRLSVREFPDVSSRWSCASWRDTQLENRLSNPQYILTIGSHSVLLSLHITILWLPPSRNCRAAMLLGWFRHWTKDPQWRSYKTAIHWIYHRIFTDDE